MKQHCDEITTAYLRGRQDVKNDVTRDVFHFLESQLPPEHRQRILTALVEKFKMDPGYMALIQKPEAFEWKG